MSDCRKCAKFEECAVDEDCGLFKPKPQTNADRIRSMTDEELARRIATKTACMGCIFSEECNRRAWHRRCEDVWLDWLKSPAEEEE